MAKLINYEIIIKGLKMVKSYIIFQQWLLTLVHEGSKDEIVLLMVGDLEVYCTIDGEGFGGHNGAIMGTGNGGCLETMVEAVKWF